MSSKPPSIGKPNINQLLTLFKQSLMSPPVLDYPRKHDHFTLTTDVSDVRLGAVLSTSRNTVIKFASRPLTSVERNYTRTKRNVWQSYG